MRIHYVRYMKHFHILLTCEIARYMTYICYYKIFNMNMHFAKLFEQLQACLLLFYLLYEYIVYVLYETLTSTFFYYHCSKIRLF